MIGHLSAEYRKLWNPKINHVIFFQTNNYEWCLSIGLAGEAKPTRIPDGKSHT